MNEAKLELVYCNSHDQVADVFTKSTRAERFKFLRDKLNVFNVEKLN